MKERTFLIDINIALPQGESIDDWSFVGHLFADIREGSTSSDSLKMMQDVKDKIDAWLLENKDVHDCFDNSKERTGGHKYSCNVCGADTTEAHQARLRLMKEHETNSRATHVVYA